MRLLRTLGFAMLILLIASGGVYLLHTYLGLELHHAAGVVLPFLGLVLGYHKYQANQNSVDTASDDHSETGTSDDEATDVQPEVEYQTKPAPLGGTADDTQSDAEQAVDDDLFDSDQGRSGPAGCLDESPLLRSNEVIIEEAEGKLAEYITFYNDGTIRLKNYDDLSLYSQMMLQVIVERLKYEYQTVDTPEIAVEEIRKAVGKNRDGENSYTHNKIEVLLFLDVARNWLTPSHRTTDIDYGELDETMVTVNLKHLSEAVDWILDDQQDHVDLLTDLRLAAAALNDARDRYEKLAEKEDTRDYPGSHENYDPVREHVLSACDHVKWYPVVVEYDGNWKRFTNALRALFDCLEDESPSKIPHYLKRMDQALANMRKIARKERGW